MGSFLQWLEKKVLLLFVLYIIIVIANESTREASFEEGYTDTFDDNDTTTEYNSTNLTVSPIGECN